MGREVSFRTGRAASGAGERKDGQAIGQDGGERYRRRGVWGFGFGDGNGCIDDRGFGYFSWGDGARWRSRFNLATERLAKLLMRYVDRESPWPWRLRRPTF